MATTNKDDQTKKVVLLWEHTYIPQFKCDEATVLYHRLALLVSFVFNNLNVTDVYHLIIPGRHFQAIFETKVYHLPQVRLIEMYYETDEDLEQARRCYHQLKKLRLCHKRDLSGRSGKRIFDQAISRPRSIDRPTLCGTALSSEDRIRAKQKQITSSTSPIPQQCFSGFDAKNKHEIDPKYLCSHCKLILRYPCQLICGHRQCQLCVHDQNVTITCSICQKITSTNEVWVDRGFQMEMQQLWILCSLCHWTGTFEIYQDHISRNHSNRPMTVTPNEAIHDTISNLSNVADPLHDDLQQRSSEFDRQQLATYGIAQGLQEINRLNELNDTSLASANINLAVLRQDNESLRRYREELALASHDGTLTWKIDNIQEKMRDAQSERTLSIYSPPFYSSPNGYKMCMRLFLNGDKHAHDTHMSVFLVIMRHEFDAILEWPFNFKVTFNLLDQSSSENNHHHYTDFFWPDSTSISFQKPHSKMNIASGIPKFFLLTLLEQKNCPFLKNDTIFVTAKIDFITKPPVPLVGASCIMVDDTRKQDTDEDGTRAILE